MYRNGIDYYMFSQVKKVFRDELNDETIDKDEILYVLNRKNFPFRSATLDKKLEGTKIVGIYNKNIINNLFSDLKKRLEIKRLIDGFRNWDTNKIVDELKSRKVEYLDKDEDEIRQEIEDAARKRREAAPTIKSIQVETDPYNYGGEESDMDKASEMLLKKEIYEALSDVEPEWTPKEGIFLEKDPKKIANYLLKNSDSKGQAMKRLTFYMNRAGENLKNKTVLNKVKALLKSDDE